MNHASLLRRLDDCDCHRNRMIITTVCIIVFFCLCPAIYVIHQMYCDRDDKTRGGEDTHKLPRTRQQQDA